MRFMHGNSVSAPSTQYVLLYEGLLQLDFELWKPHVSQHMYHYAIIPPSEETIVKLSFTKQPSPQ